MLNSTVLLVKSAANEGLWYCESQQTQINHMFIFVSFFWWRSLFFVWCSLSSYVGVLCLRAVHIDDDRFHSVVSVRQRGTYEGQADMIPSFRLSLCGSTLQSNPQVSSKPLESIVPSTPTLMTVKLQLSRYNLYLSVTVSGMNSTQCPTARAPADLQPAEEAGLDEASECTARPAGAASWTCRRTHEWPIQKKRPPPGLFSTAGANPSP